MFRKLQPQFAAFMQLLLETFQFQQISIHHSIPWISLKFQATSAEFERVEHTFRNFLAWHFSAGGTLTVGCVISQLASQLAVQLVGKRVAEVLSPLFGRLLACFLIIGSFGSLHRGSSTSARRLAVASLVLHGFS